MVNIIKICVVGDDGVGKSGIFEGKNASGVSIYQKYEFDFIHQNKEFKIQAWDIAGQEEYNLLREETYPNMDIILLCFSMVFPPSFENIVERWKEELQQFCENKPIILIGTKMDLVDDQKTLEKMEKNHMKPVTNEEIIKTAEEIHAFSFIKISAHTNVGIKNIYEQIIEAYESECIKK